MFVKHHFFEDFPHQLTTVCGEVLSSGSDRCGTGQRIERDEGGGLVALLVACSGVLRPRVNGRVNSKLLMSKKQTKRDKNLSL